MLPITVEESQSYPKQRVSYICKKKLVLMIKELEIIVILPENIEELLIMLHILTIKHQKKFPRNLKNNFKYCL